MELVKNNNKQNKNIHSWAPGTLRSLGSLSALPSTRWRAASSARPGRRWRSSTAPGSRWARPAAPPRPGCRPTAAAVCRPPPSGCSCPADAAAPSPSAAKSHKVVYIRPQGEPGRCSLSHSEKWVSVIFSCFAPNLDQTLLQGSACSFSLFITD